MLFATGVGVGVLVLVVRDGCGYRCVGAGDGWFAASIGDGGSRQVLVMVVRSRCW
jgi:hypothetical protein